MMIIGAVQQQERNRVGPGPWSPTGKSWIKGAYVLGGDSTGLTLGAANVITQWDDISGNAAHATQTTTEKVAYDAAALGGIGGIDGAASHASARIVTPSLTNVQCVYAVVQYKDPAATQSDDYYGIATIGGDAGPFLMSNGASALWAGSKTAAKNGYAASATAFPLPLSVVKWTNTAQVTGVCELANRGNYQAQFDGYYRAYVFTDNTETTAESEKLVGYLAHLSGIEGDLVSGHPWIATEPTE